MLVNMYCFVIQHPSSACMVLRLGGTRMPKLNYIGTRTTKLLLTVDRFKESTVEKKSSRSFVVQF